MTLPTPATKGNLEHLNILEFNPSAHTIAHRPSRPLICARQSQLLYPPSTTPTRDTRIPFGPSYCYVRMTIVLQSLAITIGWSGQETQGQRKVCSHKGQTVHPTRKHPDMKVRFHASPLCHLPVFTVSHRPSDAQSRAKSWTADLCIIQSHQSPPSPYKRRRGYVTSCILFAALGWRDETVADRVLAHPRSSKPYMTTTRTHRTPKS